MREHEYDLQTDKGWPRYGWRYVGLPDGGPFIGRAKKEGRNSYWVFGKRSLVSCQSIRRVRELVQRCCSCTRKSTSSTTGLSTRACKCQNGGQQCTGCYCSGWCKNRGRLIPFPTKERFLLGQFLRVMDAPASNKRASPPPI